MQGNMSLDTKEDKVCGSKQAQRSGESILLVPDQEGKSRKDPARHYQKQDPQEIRASEIHTIKHSLHTEFIARSR